MRFKCYHFLWDKTGGPNRVVEDIKTHVMREIKPVGQNWQDQKCCNM